MAITKILPLDTYGDAFNRVNGNADKQIVDTDFNTSTNELELITLDGSKYIQVLPIINTPFTGVTNGLQVVNNLIELGGSLIKPTQIASNNNNLVFEFTGSSIFRVNTSDGDIELNSSNADINLVSDGLFITNNNMVIDTDSVYALSATTATTNTIVHSDFATVRNIDAINEVNITTLNNILITGGTVNVNAPTLYRNITSGFTQQSNIIAYSIQNNIATGYSFNMVNNFGFGNELSILTPASNLVFRDARVDLTIKDIGSGKFLIEDERATKSGLEYANDITGSGFTPQSLIHRKYVDDNTYVKTTGNTDNNIVIFNSDELEDSGVNINNVVQTTTNQTPHTLFGVSGSTSAPYGDIKVNENSGIGRINTGDIVNIPFNDITAPALSTIGPVVNNNLIYLDGFKYRQWDDVTCVSGSTLFTTGTTYLSTTGELPNDLSTIFFSGGTLKVGQNIEIIIDGVYTKTVSDDLEFDFILSGTTIKNQVIGINGTDINFELTLNIIPTLIDVNSELFIKSKILYSNGNNVFEKTNYTTAGLDLTVDNYLDIISKLTGSTCTINYLEIKM